MSMNFCSLQTAVNKQWFLRWNLWFAI